MAISAQQLTIYLYSAHRAVIFAIAQLSCFIYICCFIAGFSYWTRLVSKQSWSHSHSLNTYTTHFWNVISFFKISVIFTWRLLHI